MGGGGGGSNFTFSKVGRVLTRATRAVAAPMGQVNVMIWMIVSLKCMKVPPTMLLITCL